jgi:hypothetical protein
MIWPVAELAFFALEVLRLIALSMLWTALAVLIILTTIALTTRRRR